MKNNKTSQSINDIINKLNKPAYIGIILIYAVILIVLSIVLFPKTSFIVTPNYQHQSGDTEVTTEILIVGNRRFNIQDEMVLNYSISAKVNGQIENREDSGVQINNFQMSSLLETDRVYYFVEHSDNKTPVTHYYSLSNSLAPQVPEEVYLRIKYDNDEGTEQTLTFKETILQFGRESKYTNYNIITDEEKHADKESKAQVRLGYFGEEVDGDYNLQLTIEVVDITKQFHVDMQSWIVNEKGDILPQLGIYGFTNQNYYQSSANIDLKLEPKYIYSRLVYYEEGKAPQEIYYKESLDNLPSEYNNNPVDPDPIAPTIWERLSTAEYIIIGVVIVTVVGYIVRYFIIKKKKQSIN